MHEYVLLLNESYPELVLEQLQTLGILKATGFGDWKPTSSMHVATARASIDDASIHDLLIVIGLLASHREHIHEITERYPLDAHHTRLIQAIYPAHDATLKLAADLSNSTIAALLAPFPLAALRALQIVQPLPIAGRIALYCDTLRHIQPILNGDDLKAMGLRPGPRFRTLLDGLRAARLDGIVTTREDEEAWVMERMKDEG